ncbi:MAG: hypothetical protein HY508_02875 [Acidobacteria bacterium]|nr:hypothetical protein [Acidobacteriota bacterium]
MAGGWGGRIVWLLDRCWPFPLGIAAATLAFAMAAGIWLAIRPPRPLPAGRPLGRPVSTEIPAALPTASPSPTPVVDPAVPKPIAARIATSRPTAPPESSPATTTALAKPAITKPKAQPRPVAAPLSAKQQAEFTDRLTIGRFLMDRKEYSAAIKEFQAALAINPTSREALAAIRQAREAGKQL